MGLRNLFAATRTNPPLALAEDGRAEDHRSHGHCLARSRIPSSQSNSPAVDTDLATADAMLTEGRFLWNSGLVLGRVRDFITAFETHAGDLVAPVRTAVEGAEGAG